MHRYVLDWGSDFHEFGHTEAAFNSLPNPDAGAPGSVGWPELEGIALALENHYGVMFSGGLNVDDWQEYAGSGGAVIDDPDKLPRVFDEMGFHFADG